MNGNRAYGMTLPLVTKSDGTKFGKTESGTIWLSAAKTSPYAFYQFWLQVADADAYQFLKYFTFLSVSDIDQIEADDKERQGRPEAQAILAREVTNLVHKEEGLIAAQRITDALFSGNLTDLSEGDFEQLKQDGLPSSALDLEALEGGLLTSLLSDADMGNGKQVKDALQRNAVNVNGVAIGLDSNSKGVEVFARSASIHQKYFLVKLGKKKHHLFYL
jgi:tyrosyl-tRNA synthetase